MHFLRVVYAYAKLGVLNDLQYRVNFFHQLVVSLVSLALSVVGVLLVFRHTSSLGVWTQPDLVMLLGVHKIVRGFIGLFLGPSLRSFLDGVRTGNFDFLLLKPVDVQLFVCVQRFRIWSLVDMVLGVSLVVWTGAVQGLNVPPAALLLFAVVLFAGFVVVMAFWLMLGVTSFWFVRVDNIFVVFDSLFQTAKWPVTIYPDFVRILLTFVIPVAWAVTMPAATLSGHLQTSVIQWSLLIPVGFCIGARLCWRWGIRRYSGASA